MTPPTDRDADNMRRVDLLNKRLHGPLAEHEYQELERLQAQEGKKMAMEMEPINAALRSSLSTARDDALDTLR